MGFALRFGATDVELRSDEVVFQGHYQMRRLQLRHRRFGGDWSPDIQRELFNRGDAVAVLPWDPVADVLVLIEQFRIGAVRGNDSPWMLEVVAGVVEPDEDDAEVALREAREEAACEIDRLHPMASFYPSAGACSEQIRLFCGRVRDAGYGEVHGLDTEHEDILVHAVPRAEAIDLMDAGGINNGHTLIALQWLARHGDALRQQWLSPE